MHISTLNASLASKHSACFSVEKDVLVVQANGHREPGQVFDQSICLYKRIEEKCQELGLNKVLVVSEITGRLTQRDSQKIAKFISELNFNNKLQLALLSLNFGSYLDTIFAEQVAVKLNFFGRAFHDEGNARAWLGLES